MAIVTPWYESLQYTGDPEALLSFLDGATYTMLSKTPEALFLEDGEGTPKTIPISGWVVRSPRHELVWQGSDAAYQAQWAVITP